MNKFEARKKLLVAESEVYRELLKLEFQTFKIYGMRTKRRLTSAKNYLPLMMSGFPLLSGLFGGKDKSKDGSSLKRFASLALLGWKTYQRFAPMFNRGKTAGTESTETAAEEYLSKRL